MSTVIVWMSLLLNNRSLKMRLIWKIETSTHSFYNFFFFEMAELNDN